MAGLYALPIIVIVLKEDLGSALVYMVVWLFMVFFAGIDYKVLLKSIIAAIAAMFSNLTLFFLLSLKNLAS